MPEKLEGLYQNDYLHKLMTSLRGFGVDMKMRFTVMVSSSVVLLAALGCEYEFKQEEAGKSSSLVLLHDVPHAAQDERGEGGKSAPPKPAQPADVRPTLVPGKDVSGQAAIPAKAKKLNLTEMMEQGALTVTSNVSGIGDLNLVIDEIDSTLSKSEGINPFIVTFAFTKPISLRAVRALSTYSDYGWALEIEGAERQVVDSIIDGEWSTIAFPDGVKTSRVKVEVLRKMRDNYVHLNEIELYE